MLRNRAMSRSLSIPSKSTSYHSLQNEAAASTVTTDSEINTGTFVFLFLYAYVCVIYIIKMIVRLVVKI